MYFMRHCCARRAQQAEPPPIAQVQRMAIRHAAAACGLPKRECVVEACGVRGGVMRVTYGTVISRVAVWDAVGGEKWREVRASVWSRGVPWPCAVEAWRPACAWLPPTRVARVPHAAHGSPISPGLRSGG